MPQALRLEIKRKFKATVIQYYRDYKAGRAEPLPALDALREYQQEKKLQNNKLKERRETVEKEVSKKLDETLKSARSLNASGSDLFGPNMGNFVNASDVVSEYYNSKQKHQELEEQLKKKIAMGRISENPTISILNPGECYQEGERD
jgi:uncharacterized protein with gpF-like domain